MSKMYIMKGLPAAGKSHRARKIMKADGNAIRINKDLLRTMLHFDKFNGRLEGMTKDAARTLARFFLKTNNVIIDDTNLNPGVMQSWKDLAKEENAKIEVVDMTDVPIEECLIRDRNREKEVGNTVIKNMALRYGLLEYPSDSVVICDIDGTIADTTHRLHYVNQADGKKDWKGFFSEMDKDPVIESTRRLLVEYYNQMKTIIFVSARPDTYRDVTLKWLGDNFLSFGYTLIMRQAHDKRPDTDVKRDILKNFFPYRGAIHCVIDDRPSVIQMWREEGLKVIDVGKGIDF